MQLRKWRQMEMDAKSGFIDSQAQTPSKCSLRHQCYRTHRQMVSYSYLYKHADTKKNHLLTSTTRQMLTSMRCDYALLPNNIRRLRSQPTRGKKAAPWDSQKHRQGSHLGGTKAGAKSN